MVVSVILDSEYMGMGERFKWFLKSVTYAKRNDWVIVTHEYIKTHLEELLHSCADRFYDEFEMDRVSIEEIRGLNICYIPDSLFENIYINNGARTKMIFDLTNNRHFEIEEYVISYINDCLRRKRDNKVEYIMNCIHTFESIKYIADYYNCPLIPYVFSSIRKVHGYYKTLYMAHIDKELFNSIAPKKLYDDYILDLDLEKLYTRPEIMALIGKRHNLILIPLMNVSGTYEMGIIKEAFQITPQAYQIDNMTDDDLYYEFKRNYNEKIKTRIHPMLLDQVGIGRAHMKNDPAAFILSCKRLATMHSQMIVKAALWNRTTCLLGNQLPYSFLFSHNFIDNDPMDILKLNFLIFCYFIPDQCMFSEEYWKWRMTNPSAKEIAQKHISVLLESIDLNFKSIERNAFLESLLKARGCVDSEIKQIIQYDSRNKYSIEYPSSKIVIHYYNGNLKEIYTINFLQSNYIVSYFLISDYKEMEYLDVYLLCDIDGQVSIKEIEINGKSIKNEGTSGYRKKNQIQFTISCKEEKEIYSLKILWMAKTFEEMLC